MSRVFKSQRPDYLFTSRREIEDHILAKLSNDSGKVGTELELFVTTPSGEPIEFATIEKIFEKMASEVAGAQRLTEDVHLVGLHLPGIGDVSLEPGGQVELSTLPCANLDELRAQNLRLRALLDRAAESEGAIVQGRGHMKSFLTAPDMPRSRFHAYYAYCRARFGVAAEDLIATMKSACGLQVNVDPMGKDFHEIYRALLLTDVATSLSERTERQRRLHDTYARIAPEQLTPLFNALSAKSNAGLVEKIVTRLMSLKVPFIPDPSSKEGYKSTMEAFGHAPTVSQLMERGILTAEILDNALSLQLTMPNLRRHGVLETRAPDSPATVDDVMRVAEKYATVAYDAVERKKLIKAFASVSPRLLKDVFLHRFDFSEDLLRACKIGGGLTAGDLMDYFAPSKTLPATAQARQRKF